MHGVYGIAGGARRRPTKSPGPDVDARLYRAHWSGSGPEFGTISADKVTPSSMTHLYVSTKGEELEDNSNWLAEVCANMYDLTVELDDDPNCFIMFRVTAVTAGTDSYDFTVTYLSSGGNISDGAPVRFEIYPVFNALWTAKGDLIARGATSPIRLPVGSDSALLVADASTASGLNWLIPMAFWFGAGNNGSSTLGSNTTLTINLELYRAYTTLDLATFSLSSIAGGNMGGAGVYCCSVLLTGNGGSIKRPLSGDATAGGASVSSGTAVSGAGGTYSDLRAGIFVFARKMSGTLTIDGSGGDGGIGGNGTGTPAGIFAGRVGVSSDQLWYFNAGGVINGTPALAGAGGAAGGTAGGTSTASTQPEPTSAYYDIMRYFMQVRTAPCDNQAVAQRYNRMARHPGGQGGASGGLSNTTTASGGGGGASSYAMGNVAGSQGGAGGAGGGTTGVGGGGGGSGANGTFVGVMVGEFAAATTLTIDAHGGNGGNGGNGSGNGGGGGGGAGGVGGIIYAVFPVNYSTNATVTLNVAAGAKGNKGLKAGLGTDGNDGNAGSAGKSAILTWAA